MPEPQNTPKEAENTVPITNAEVIPGNIVEKTISPTSVINPPSVSVQQDPEVESTFSNSTTDDGSQVLSETAPPSSKEADSITWSASEFHNHEKSAFWYLKLAISTAGASAISYILTKSVVTLVVVVMGGVVIGFYGRHKPRQLEYVMNTHGIRVGSKQYLYDEFRLFVVTPDSSYPEISLIPVKRFMPPLSVRYEPADETKILDMLADHLPFEERRPDLVDSLMRRIHF
jgi:hypothetical protein